MCSVIRLYLRLSTSRAAIGYRGRRRRNQKASIGQCCVRGSLGSEEKEENKDSVGSIWEAGWKGVKQEYVT